MNTRTGYVILELKEKLPKVLDSDLAKDLAVFETYTDALKWLTDDKEFDAKYGYNEQYKIFKFEYCGDDLIKETLNQFNYTNPKIPSIKVTKWLEGVLVTLDITNLTHLAKHEED